MGGLRRLLVLFVALVILALSGAIRSLVREYGAESAGPSEKLVIISPHWEGIRFEIGEAFERAMAARGRPVKVEWINPGGTSACVRFVRSRFTKAKNGIGIDLFFGGGVEPHLTLAAEKLLEPVPLAEGTLDGIPQMVAGAAVYDAAAGWYGTCLTTFGIAYNKALLPRLGIPEPTSFADLGEPRARTWVALADPRLSGSVHMIYELVLQARGWEEGYRLLVRMAANSRRMYHHAAEVPIEIGAGEAALGASLDSYAWAQVEALGRESIGFTAPAGETITNPDAIAALRGAPNADLAKLFIEFTLSPAGQELWFLPRGAKGGPTRYVLGRIPVRPDVLAARRAESTVTFDPFTAEPGLTYDPKLGSARWSVVDGLVGSALIDAGRELSQAWEEVVAAGRPPEAEEMLTRPPFAVEEALRLGAGEFRNPTKRNDLLAEITREAIERYAKARELARAHAARRAQAGGPS